MKTNQKELEVYIHIPFCVRKCAYCDFLSGPADEAHMEAYVTSLIREIRESREQIGTMEGVSVFFGGGTPSLLTPDRMKRIMEAVRANVSLTADAEISMEMNPGTVTREKLSAYREAGINRVSIGLQSTYDEELKLLGRIHTFEDFKKTFAMVREEGFTNVSLDLMSALPGQTLAKWEENVRRALEFEPEHISAYSLIIEEGTPFFERYGDAAELLPGEETERAMYHRTKEILAANGYERYEISNYAKKGYECRHNLGYWRRVPYIGYGIGAASLLPNERTGELSRYTNPSGVSAWEGAFAEKFTQPGLSRNEAMEEFMFLGLRTMKGVDEREFRDEFGAEMKAEYGEQIGKMCSLGFLEWEGERLRLTEAGIDVSNQVFVEFLK